MRIFYDQLDRKMVLEHSPRRIVSLVPSQTELLVDLGLRERISGVTKFCVHPVDLRQEKTVVGGTKQVNLQKIREIRPDIILCNKEENTPQMVKDLETIAAVHVSDVMTVNDSLELIREYGEIFEVQKAASTIVGEILDRKQDFEEFVDQFPKKRVAYFIWKNPWMVVGKNTFIDHLLELNNFTNVFSKLETRYPEVELEDLKSLDVDLIFLSTEPFPFKEEDKENLENQLENTRVQVVDGEYFSWYGSRLTGAFDYFKKLHEERLLS